MEVVAILISIVALAISTIVAVWGWWRHRNIYGIERVLFFRQQEVNASSHNLKSNEELRKKLSSGHYTILHTSEYGGYIELVIGRIKR